MRTAQVSQRLTTAVIVEDHPLMCEAIAMFIARDFPDMGVRYSGPCLDEALAVCGQGTLAIIDLDLGRGQPPLDVVGAALDTGAVVLVVSALAQPLLVTEVLSRGAHGYVAKSSGIEVLIDAVRTLSEGDEWVSQEVAGMIVGDRRGAVHLSTQERLALTLYSSGLTLDAVARRMGVARSTAKEYIDRVRRKYEDHGLKARTKTELHITARQQGIIA